MAIEILEINSSSEDFIELTRLLDEDLVRRYGEVQKQYDKYNRVDYLSNVVVLYVDRRPVGCGAFKPYGATAAEIKRIFVKEEYRKQGLAELIVNRVEALLKEKGYTVALLETGIKQPEAINFYAKIGYQIIENYPPYVGNPNSLCMRKNLAEMGY